MSEIIFLTISNCGRLHIVPNYQKNHLWHLRYISPREALQSTWQPVEIYNPSSGRATRFVVLLCEKSVLFSRLGHVTCFSQQSTSWSDVKRWKEVLRVIKRFSTSVSFVHKNEKGMACKLGLQETGHAERRLATDAQLKHNVRNT